MDHGPSHQVVLRSDWREQEVAAGYCWQRPLGRLSGGMSSPWTNLSGPARREDGEKDFSHLFLFVCFFLHLGSIFVVVSLEEKRVRRICFYSLAKKSAVVLLLQITSVYKCLNNFLVRKISCESGRYIFSFWIVCVSEWISSWETYWRPVNCKPKLFFWLESHRSSGYKICGLVTWLSFNPYLSFLETYKIIVIRITLSFQC